MCAGRLFHSETADLAVHHSGVEEPLATTTTTTPIMQQMQQIASSEAVEAAAMASKYRKYERDYLRRINHLYFSSSAPDDSGELFESAATVDEFVIKESKEPPMKKFLAHSGLVHKQSLIPKIESMDIDANLPSTSSKKSQRATPDGTNNRKRDRSNK